MWNQGDRRVVILSFDVDHPELGVNMVSHFYSYTSPSSKLFDPVICNKIRWTKPMSSPLFDPVI